MCHEAAAGDLAAGRLPGAEASHMRRDLNSLCLDCHVTGFSHPTGVVPGTNEDGLPLDAAGQIACAVTCHDMHRRTGDPVQTRMHLRAPPQRLCLGCHPV